MRNEGTGPDGLGNDYGAAVNLITATEESINTAYVDLTRRSPTGRRRSSTPPTSWASRSGTASKYPYNHLHNSPGLESVA